MIEALFKQFLEHAKTLKAAIAFLWRRMGALRLPQVAGSLSYTTVLSLVPLLVIVLSILTIYRAQLASVLGGWCVFDFFVAVYDVDH